MEIWLRGVIEKGVEFVKLGNVMFILGLRWVSGMYGGSNG